MSVSAEFLDHVTDLLSGIGRVTHRRMFGGAGLYLDGTIFAIVAADVLYFKTDEKNREDFERAGTRPFVPFENKPFPMSYWEVPPELLEDPEALAEWARRAWEASRRSGSETKSRNRQ